MCGDLDRLAECYGVAHAYLSEAGWEQQISRRAKLGVLKAMGIAAANDDEIKASLLAAPDPQEFAMSAPPGVRCFVPKWLEHGRTWGMTCQLYGLRSARNLGIGDFEDLARLAEHAAGLGADFIGVNPLHALFLAEPSRISPYSPSHRRFLNPLYIAVDQLETSTSHTTDRLAKRPNADLVDYPAVFRAKRAAFEGAYESFCEEIEIGSVRAAAFEAFCSDRDSSLEAFATFEALSEVLVASGHACGWHLWPEEYRRMDSSAVQAFRKEHAGRIRYHKWLQWRADEQLKEAQRRALAAGMRIGLLLDLAVGVAPDGAATWADPDLVVAGARIGSPPDAFNSQGQDWGLAPLSPAALTERSLQPFHDLIRDLMRHAGAIRIDHVMGLMRLYWIPEGADPTDGAYVRYPMPEMIRRMAAVSHEKHAVVIGEDLGTVPPGFRDVMRSAEIQGYRVLFFEREDGRFRTPDSYSRETLACVGTHDLPTLAGWWSGRDVELREQLGRVDGQSAARQRSERELDRLALLRALDSAGVLPAALQPMAAGAHPVTSELPDALFVAIHEFIARTKSRLIAVQLEDLVGEIEQPNLPGTVDEHPNWRRRLSFDIDELGSMPRVQEIAAMLARERPRRP